MPPEQAIRREPDEIVRPIDYRALYFAALKNIETRIQSAKDSLATAESDRVAKLQGEIRGLLGAVGAFGDAEKFYDVDPRGVRSN